jgi:fermentation-respiration switch protein FrsA (DUF1100 family)
MLLCATGAAGLATERVATAGTGGRAAPSQPTAGRVPFAVGIRTSVLVDRSRRIHRRGGRSVPRRLVTDVRYPALGTGTDLADAPPARGPFPVIVFAHGFDGSPTTYAGLLRSWAAAGYVVAAPRFPLTSTGAPGGPQEADVVNQPGDVSFVISSLLAASSSPGPLAGLVDPGEIAVAGHSDGGETALAVAFSRRYRDTRVRAALVLSGAEISGIGGYAFRPGGPALLAVQGTRDTSNEPRYTYAYFGAARRPKYLLRLLGAGHLPPYTTEPRELSVVEGVTRAFLNAYLEHAPAAAAELATLGNRHSTASLVSDP